MSNQKFMIGEQVYPGCPEMLFVNKEPLISFEIGNNNQLTINSSSYNRDGKKIVQVVKNVLVINDNNENQIVITPNNVKVKRKKDGVVLIDATVVDQDMIKLRGIFYVGKDCYMATPAKMILNPPIANF
ncbi:MAG: hypothetical protein HY036_00495 [Nitrospirae bacterium]|nr:hypothetical protein [Nitrospirota bacterium]MBI3351034.1 hypothetical protein [Nitrospirota bacterium]